METRTYEKTRTYRVTVPDIGSADWDELTARLFRRADMRRGFWSADLVVGALMSEYPDGGGFVVEDYDPDSHKTTERVLAEVRWDPGTELKEVRR